MGGNFEFLKSIKDVDYQRICGGLYEACAAAEHMLAMFPDASISQSRKAAELTTKLFFVKCVDKNTKDAEGRELPVFKLMTDPRFEPEVIKRFGKFEAEEVLRDLHTIRKHGNAGAHARNADAESAARGLFKKVQERVPQILGALNLTTSRQSDPRIVSDPIPRGQAQGNKTPTAPPKPDVPPRPPKPQPDRQAPVQPPKPRPQSTNAAQATKQQPQDPLWKVDTLPDGTLQICEYRGNDKDVIVPAQIGGVTVTEIGPEAFFAQLLLTSISIPNTVTRIGHSAFGVCTDLRRVSIPSSLMSIDRGAFGLCDNLTDITVAQGSKYFAVMDGMLLDKRQNLVVVCAKNVTGHISIPEGIEGIGDFAFSGCSGLTSITIPNSVTDIDSNAFSGCSGLTEVSVPGRVTSIGESAFSWCSHLTKISIPDSVTNIGPLAFDNCERLARISIPVAVKIHKGSFAQFGEGTTVTIRPAPAPVKEQKKAAQAESTRWKASPTADGTLRMSAQFVEKEAVSGTHSGKKTTSKSDELIDRGLLEQMADALIAKMPKDHPVANAESLREDTVYKLNDLVFDSVLGSLNRKQLAELNTLLNNEDAEADAFQAFYDKHDIDVDQIIADALRSFIAEFWGDTQLDAGVAQKAAVTGETKPRVGLNDKCPCGSGKKYKHCCGANSAPSTSHNPLKAPAPKGHTKFGWGPERETFTMSKPASYPVFNSITDNPTIGDERAFVRVGEIRQEKTELKHEVEIIPGKQYLVYIYFHNDASATYNDAEHQHSGIALKTRMSTSFTTVLTPEKRGVVTGTITAENANPASVWSEAYLTTKTEKVLLRYVAGSAKIYCDWPVDGSVLSSNLFTETGTLIGLTALNGVIPGCEQYHGVVSYVLQAEELSGSIEKTVSKDGKNYGKSVSAAPGEQLFFKLSIRNVGDVKLMHAHVMDAIPAGLTVLSGSVGLCANQSKTIDPVSDVLFSQGLTLGTIGTGNTINLVYTAIVNSGTSDVELLNRAKLTYDSEATSGDIDESEVTVTVK